VESCELWKQLVALGCYKKCVNMCLMSCMKSDVGMLAATCHMVEPWLRDSCHAVQLLPRNAAATALTLIRTADGSHC
jgi:hypothetical protein